MAEKIKAIVKRADEPIGHMTNISPRLENLQKTVEGYIEAVRVAEDMVILCNEEGKLLGLPPNMPHQGDMLVGTLIFVGVNGEEFCDIPISFAEYKRIFFGIGG